jgi:hypothetical protein
MKNSLSVVDKQIKKNRSKIATPNKNKNQNKSKAQGRKHKSERAPVPAVKTREGREDRDRTF